MRGGSLEVDILVVGCRWSRVGSDLTAGIEVEVQFRVREVTWLECYVRVFLA
jgi:hypothetical protein